MKTMDAGKLQEKERLQDSWEQRLHSCGCRVGMEGKKGGSPVQDHLRKAGTPREGNKSQEDRNRDPLGLQKNLLYLLLAEYWLILK